MSFGDFNKPLFVIEKLPLSFSEKNQSGVWCEKTGKAQIGVHLYY
jgi:hypothetical protein